MTERLLRIKVNPEPWAIGPLTTGRNGGKIFPKIGRNQQLFAFKEAVKAELEGQPILPDGEYELDIYFWRQIAQYRDTSGAKRHRNVADATNMQKATEDALQEVLFKNDRNVKRIRSTVVEEGPDVEGRIVVRARMWHGLDPSELPDEIWDWVEAGDDVQEEFVWTPDPDGSPF